ncbi:MAG: hypothetical protein ABL932_22050 [Terricaulis sp.]
MSDTNKRNEFLALALAARRRESRAGSGASKVEQGRPVPTPHDDAMSDFIKTMTPKQRELYRKFLECDE